MKTTKLLRFTSFHGLNGFILIIFLFLSGISRSQSALDYMVKAETYAEAGDIKNARNFFLKAHAMSPYDMEIQRSAIEFLIKVKDYESLERFLDLYNMKNEDHNTKALKLYYQGIIHMQAGVEEFHDAFADFREAKYEIERSFTPDLDLWADILVACGYSKVVTRTHSSDGKGYHFSILRVEDFMEAYPYYKKALVLDPEHDVALKNLEEIKYRITDCEKDLPVIPDFSYNLEQLKKRIHQDSIKKDSLNYINKLRTIQLQHLPKSIGHMVSILNQYDEIMLVIDISGSMEDHVDWGAEISRFDVMQELSIAILKQVKESTNIGGISVGGVCGFHPLMMSGIGQNTRFEMSDLIDSVEPDGWTPLNRILIEAGTLFSTANNKKTVLLISDGMDSCEEGINLCDTAMKLHNAGIDLTVFSFLLEGTSHENNFAYRIYECMTEAANGKIFYLDQNGIVRERQKRKKREQYVDFTLPTFINTNRYKVIDCLTEFDWKPIRDSKSFMKE